MTRPPTAKEQVKAVYQRACCMKGPNGFDVRETASPYSDLLAVGITPMQAWASALANMKGKK